MLRGKLTDLYISIKKEKMSKIYDLNNHLEQLDQIKPKVEEGIIKTKEKSM